MNNPFLFGKIASGRSFVNRKKEIKRLTENFEAGINTVLISPRRWGKSSLVRKVADSNSDKKKYRFCFLDMFNVRNENDFYNLYASEIIKSTSNKFDEWTKATKQFLSSLVPKISFGIDPDNDFSIQIDWKNMPDSYIDILNLPEKIARQKNFTLIICIDEFQNISNFENPDIIQKRMRAQWQHHQHVVYNIYGSKRHMLAELFENQSMPFFKFGDTFYLEKIEKSHLSNFIVRQFRKTRKQISIEFACEITDLMQCHPYYVQQLSFIIWNNTSKNVTTNILNSSIEDLLNRNSLLFQKEFESLSNSQINFLRLLIESDTTNYTSNEAIKEFNLGSSSNVIRVMQSLEKKEVLDRFTKEMFFVDPAFQLWLGYKVFKG